MKELSTLNPFFWKYRKWFFAGILFVLAANYFAILAPQIMGYVVSLVQQQLPGAKPNSQINSQDFLVANFIHWMELKGYSFGSLVAIGSITILILALIRGVLMFAMRQTLIVMSRHIEFDQKNQIYQHYQLLDMQFYKTHATGDLMNRITEDVSRVRMYSGPAIMYLINLITLIRFCLFHMMNKDLSLTLMVLSPLPILAFTIYYVNSIINKKSEKIQSLLSDLTSNAQESYAGIRVIKSFVQEKAMLLFFKKNSEAYQKNVVELAKVEAVYFPSIALLIGLSTLTTILIGGIQAIQNPNKIGLIVEFVIYINLLTFPVSAIGWTASIIQRASASQKRINAFLLTPPSIANVPMANQGSIDGSLACQQLSFTYQHTGIQALKNIHFTLEKGEHLLIVGKTGSGKTTLAELLLRLYEPTQGKILLNNLSLENYDLANLRTQISFVQQDVFLFSDTIAGNIRFGMDQAVSQEEIENAAKIACIHDEILMFEKGYDTLIGERGVTLSGGQKQRMAIARALIKKPSLIIFDDCLSAVDARTEQSITQHLKQFLKNKTSLFIAHRINPYFHFDKIIVLENGEMIENGTHEQLLAKKGYYAKLYENRFQEGDQASKQEML